MELRLIITGTPVKFNIDKQEEIMNFINSIMSTREYDISIKNPEDNVIEIGFDYKNYFKKKQHLVWLSNDEYENLLNYRGKNLV